MVLFVQKVKSDYKGGNVFDFSAQLFEKSETLTKNNIFQLPKWDIDHGILRQKIPTESLTMNWKYFSGIVLECQSLFNNQIS
jgi:hypothetical protein